jgi:excisionase family DNA binding protein
LTSTVVKGILFIVNSVVPTREETPRRGYRIAEAAVYMGASPWYVELKVRSGELQALKLGRHWVILREDMDQFLDAQRAALKKSEAAASERAA